MPNHASLDSRGFIHSVLEGDQDESTVSQLIGKASQMLQQQQSEGHGRTFNFLVDVSHVGAQTLAARKVGVKALKTMPYQKIAIVGAGRFIKHTMSLLIIASGQTDKVRQFEDETNAIRWLCE